MIPTLYCLPSCLFVAHFGAVGVVKTVVVDVWKGAIVSATYAAPVFPELTFSNFDQLQKYLAVVLDAAVLDAAVLDAVVLVSEGPPSRE